MRVGKVHILIGKITTWLQRILREAKIPIDYEHNQTGLHEITVCDDRGNVEGNNPRTPSFERSPEKNFYSLLIGNGNKQQNKPTADWISNKNAIASNNVSFVSNVVRRFHWLCLKNTFLLTVFRHFVCCFSSSLSLSTVSMMTCDLQVNQSQL